MISPKHTTVRNMGDVLRGFLSRDVALRFVPSKLSSKDITKKIQTLQKRNQFLLVHTR